MIPYFDAHCDTVTAVLERGGSLLRNGYQLDLERLGEYRPAAQVFAVWGGRYDEKVGLLRSELKRSGIGRLCRSVAELRQTAAEGKLAALLSLEGMEQFDCDTERLRLAREEDGLIMVNLCWNSDNALCGSAMDGGGGLTARGREFVREAQGMGVAVDLSHASERAFWDTLEVSTKPVLASHSDSAALCSIYPRNLTDAQFAALAKQGGGAGINLYPDFLGLTRDTDAVCAHVERFLSLGGERAVFIGADLDGIDDTPRDIAGAQDTGRLYEALLRRGYPESLVRDIFWNNLVDILERATT